MKRNNNGRLVVLLLTAALLAALCACGSTAKKARAPGAAVSLAYENPATFRMLYSSEAETLNYLVSYSSVDTALSANLIDALVDYDACGNIRPGLAESWSSNAEMTEWTFRLREGINWYDCDGNCYAPVTADDWVAAAQYVNDAANASGIQYMYSTGAVVVKAQDYYNYTASLLDSERFEAPPRKIRAEEIGVRAPDERTLVYTLEQPCPFFLSVLSYPSYLPVNRAYLKEQGEAFGTGKEHLLYNGAFILTEFAPMERHELTRNPGYWDAENVHIDVISQQYSTDAPRIGVEKYMAGEIDCATVEASRADELLADPETAEELHRSRPEDMWSYFYLFNFDPQFDAQYEPENWRRAVANEEFRKTLSYALDRENALRAYDPESPESLCIRTLTLPGILEVNGVDFTEYGALARVSARDPYDPERALAYRDLARIELAEEGVTFPIKVLMPYNPATAGWSDECAAVEEQMENLLGRDFIDVIVLRGPETGFLTEIRSGGKYAFMKCRWGADYADPQTWAEPFQADSGYCFWDRSENQSIKMHYEAWASKAAKASGIYESEGERGWFFAEAEALLIEHAIAVPFSTENRSYVMSRLCDFEGEYAPYGVVNQRYKGYVLHDSSMSMEEYDAAYEQWRKAKGLRLTAAVPAGR